MPLMVKHQARLESLAVHRYKFEPDMDWMADNAKGRRQLMWSRSTVRPVTPLTRNWTLLSATRWRDDSSAFMCVGSCCLSDTTGCFGEVNREPDRESITDYFTVLDGDLGANKVFHRTAGSSNRKLSFDRVLPRRRPIFYRLRNHE